MTLLNLSGVSRTYDGDVPVEALTAFDLEVSAGEFLAVLGPSGSGKSTLLNVLGLLDRASEGSYRIADIETSDLSEPEIAALRSRFFGFVFQAFHLLATRTAAENVEMGMLYGGLRRRDRRERAVAALNQVDLAHRMDAFPGTLSGGERQRVAIARAICSRADVLLCDEPTGNLDSSTARDLLDRLHSLNRQGQTIVVVTHDDKVAQAATRRIGVTDGRVLELP